MDGDVVFIIYLDRLEYSWEVKLNRSDMED